VDARRLSAQPLRAALLVCSLLLLSACRSGPPADPSAGSTARPVVELALQATSGYGRHAAVRARADLRLVNTGDAELRLATLQVQHPLFERLPPYERRTVLPPDGDVRLVPVPLGEPRCDQDDPAGASLVIGLRTPDGIRDVELPLQDREPGLVRAHRLACAVDAVQDVVTVELQTTGVRTATPAGEGLAMQLWLRRQGAGAVTVTELLGSILFRVAGRPPAPLLQLDAGTDAASAQVVVVASRCDQHALIESKTSFTFPLFAQIDGGQPARVSTTATGAARDALQALLHDTCGAAARVSTSP